MTLKRMNLFLTCAFGPISISHIGWCVIGMLTLKNRYGRVQLVQEEQQVISEASQIFGMLRNSWLVTAHYEAMKRTMGFRPYERPRATSTSAQSLTICNSWWRVLSAGGSHKIQAKKHLSARLTHELEQSYVDGITISYVIPGRKIFLSPCKEIFLSKVRKWHF